MSKNSNRGISILIAIGITVVLIVVVVGGGILVWKYYQKVSNVQNQNSQTADWKTYNDEVTSLLFKYPKEWGEVVAKNTFEITNVLRELSFTKQPAVKLVADNGYLWPAAADIEMVMDIYFANYGNIKKFCNEAYDPSQKYIRNCDKNFLYTIKSPTNITKNIFISPTNKLFNGITLKVNVPGGEIKSGNYDDSIKKYIKSFEDSGLSKSVDSLVSSVKAIPGDKYLEIYKNYFNQKQTYKNWGIEFKYPIVFGSPTDSTYGGIIFENKDNPMSDSDFSIIEMNSLIAKQKKNYDDCMNQGGELCGPMAPISLEYLQSIKDALTKNSGNISCECKSCKIANFGGQKIFFKDQCRGYGDFINEKYFSFNYKIFKIDMPVKSDFSNLSVSEKSHFEIYEDILKSMQPSFGSDIQADWKTYNWTIGVNIISFQYPKDWIVNKEYYATPAEQIAGTSTNIGLFVCSDKNENNNNINYPNECDGIHIDGRQNSCDSSENHAKCISKSGHIIFTDSKNQEVLSKFDQIVSTFKLTK